MDGLDLLKKHWQKNEEFPQINKEEIRGMLHKNSSSIVKWIFYISVIELFLGLALNIAYLFYDKEPNTEHIFFRVMNDFVDIATYLIIVYFVYIFFSQYKNIKNTKNTKELLNSILKTRKTVNYYIKFNIYFIIYAVTCSSISVLYDRYQENNHVGEIIFVSIIVILLMSLFAWLFIFIVKGYYRIIYLRLVKKLDKNYEQLLELDADEIETPLKTE
ncbi:hypothetical protein ACFRAE_12320 [Sphingobacterium sp. HJSM2_6]|uniref:hypothetical protein n=1 Tax=Sphingobacterium sp. HJSM2_6 TaxID=3366264 RepID=UPI003BC96F72